jgi:hypothetical protein
MRTGKCLVVLPIMFIVLFAGIASADLSIGVKKGDFIQYQVISSGTPPPDHLVVSAEMLVLDVQSPTIKIMITTTSANGSQTQSNSTLNLQTGQLIEDFIIPANLQAGESFTDSNVGKITISSVEQRVYAGATRTVVTASTHNTTFVWDQATGFSLDGTSQGTDYSIRTVATATNMWQPQELILGLAPTSFYIILTVLIAIVIIVILAAVFVSRRRNKAAK